MKPQTRRFTTMLEKAERSSRATPRLLAALALIRRRSSGREELRLEEVALLKVLEQFLVNAVDAPIAEDATRVVLIGC